ncbi:MULTISPECIES: sulfatase-like hydrolase/transferase [unclassified Alcanivorax]|uniref:sulfatase-like hydrolase/transferase n=1 Tax=unclassified Alcanivorax TaxID=2638842 RepID=UPI00062CF775|nr:MULTISPECIES: sulfatase-like hydrolase/transferase [unclassified Alcanivorax]
MCQQRLGRISLRGYYVFLFLLFFILNAWVGRGTLVVLPSLSLLFMLVALSGYAFLYVLLVAALGWLLGNLPGRSVQAVGVVVLAALMTMLLLVDGQIYAIYGFHINGFVWNLITTPGGIESMGGSAGTSWTVAAICVAVLLIHGVVLYVLRSRSVPRLGLLVSLLVLCMVGERAAYGVSHLKGYRPVLMAAQSIPFYQPTTFRRVAEKWGITMVRSTRLEADAKGRLNYPKEPLRVSADAPHPNLLVLVAESLRWDMLTPEIMPNLWRFSAQHGIRFTQHYSGGNGTRMGLFSLFYGLPGNYWFSVLDERKPPLLMQQLQQAGYHMGLYTSANFSYPEFDKTLFVSVPEKDMLSDDVGPGWQRDRRNVERLLDFLGEQKVGMPFMGFMFFESAHARYYFPDESVIRKDYLPEMNYATMDLKADMPGIFRRYVNASHHLDQQLGRVLGFMKASGKLDNTIVVVTGDHGEEFMENGRWGHNSEFHNEQIHVPLVLAFPGNVPGVVTRPTSHLDVVPTLLPMLGVQNPASDYSVGHSLLGPQGDAYRLVASWDALAYVGPDYKVAMPLGAGGLLEMRISDAHDGPVSEPDTVLAQLSEALADVLRDLSAFFRK